MRDDLPSRSTVAAVLLLPLLAVAVLSGLGVLANHEAARDAELLRAALEGGSGPRSGPDLAAWSSASAARVERMRVVELGLSGEVAHPADRAAGAADRRALAYGAALVTAVGFAAVIWLLAPRPGRRTTGSPEDRAGGEPIRRRDRPAAMAEVVAAAVRDNRDAPRVDVVVADELLVPQRAADDLANLLGELIDNATAFSAPETRVRVSGQKTGSGYVFEVEDRGLGMTDEELDGVNRRLAGQPVTDPDLEQRLGTWVAGRLADRHDVKVQLRRSAHGGVTAFVFLPQHLVIAPPGKDEAQGAAIAWLQSRRYPTKAGVDADRSLPKRAPNTSLAPDLAASQAQGVPGRPESRPSPRSPEEVRSMLARYRSGIERGRAAARDLPEDPEGAGRRPGQAPEPGS